MVCAKCEKKLSTVCVPDKWKDGARNVQKTIGKTRSAGAVRTGQIVNRNMLLKKLEVKNVAENKTNCRICKSQVHQFGCHYCQNCAYNKGICAMCGTKILDTKFYRQSAT